MRPSQNNLSLWAWAKTATLCRSVNPPSDPECAFQGKGATFYVQLGSRPIFDTTKWGGTFLWPTRNTFLWKPPRSPQRHINTSNLWGEGVSSPKAISSNNNPGSVVSQNYKAKMRIEHQSNENLEDQKITLKVGTFKTSRFIVSWGICIRDDGEPGIQRGTGWWRAGSVQWFGGWLQEGDWRGRLQK